MASSWTIRMMNGETHRSNHVLPSSMTVCQVMYTSTMLARSSSYAKIDRHLLIPEVVELGPNTMSSHCLKGEIDGAESDEWPRFYTVPLKFGTTGQRIADWKFTFSMFEPHQHPAAVSTD
ncbi:hypothetical protein Moror_4983 [Moniliophthora roreri MCA 2997]|uniref:Uncharacterized protein n=1 Tax=Moniliophthora roreri (strain MCA 2997) TaxID=1381753 RepID=V2X1Q7_MONRO|nr:hypothetical protein Moror_4983 [Moniliophthora roreri MCA 2997]